jgi:hypothetical protein
LGVVVILMVVQIYFLYLVSSEKGSETVHDMPQGMLSNSSILAFKMTTTHQSHIINDALVFPGNPRKLKIAHVINLYSIEVKNGTNGRSQFYPLDQAQNVTIASMTRARANAASRLNITLYSAIFPGEDHIVPDGFEKLYLNRSTMTEYPNLDKGKGRKLPFIQDIFQGVYDIADFDYFIYTNTDIGLHESFYNIVAAIIDKGSDSFTINRRTLQKAHKEQELTGNDLDLIFEMIPEGNFHPGMDCFIIHRDEMPRVTLGDMFMGYPPWGRALETILADTAKTHTTHFSDLNATFHLGNDESWSEKNSPSIMVNMELKDFLQQCKPVAWRFNRKRPMTSMTPYRLQNTKNCATVFVSINN